MSSIDQYLPFLMVIPVLWIAGWTLASVKYRRSRGKPIVFTGADVEGATYVETTASGRSHRTWYTRAGGASRCLVVAVATGRLIIRPRFPFNLLFLPEIYGLEYEVPLERIVSVEARGGWLGGVDLQLRDSTNDVHTVTLNLRDPNRFIEALGRRPR